MSICNNAYIDKYLIVMINMAKSHNFTFIDLCCGVGAFHIALKKHGGKCVLACDKDKRCKEIYLKNHGDDIRWEDDLKKIESLPKHDVLCAGFPCQPFSLAGLGQGVKDSKGRGTIIYRIFKLLDACVAKPRLIMLENVHGILTHPSLMQYITTKLASLGYNVYVNEYEASVFGSPISRKRVIIYGTRNIELNVCRDPQTSLLEQKLKKNMYIPVKSSRILEECDVVDNSINIKYKTTNLRSILEDDVHKKYYLTKAKYKLFAESNWSQHEHKIFVGYIPEKSPKPGRPTSISAHRQGFRIYHIDGGCETFTSDHKYYIYIPETNRVRSLTSREMFSCMGFPRKFKLHDKDTVARLQVSNSINMYMLQPLVDWVVKEIKLVK